MASQMPKINFEKMFSGAILRCSEMKIQSLESKKQLGTIQKPFSDHMKHFEKIEKKITFFHFLKPKMQAFYAGFGTFWSKKFFENFFSKVTK